MSISKRGNNFLMVLYLLIIFFDYCNGLNVIKTPENTARNAFVKTPTESVSNFSEISSNITNINSTETVIEDISVIISKAASEDSTKLFKEEELTKPEKEPETFTKNPSKTPDPKASEQATKISEETKKILETYGKHYDVTTLKSADDEEEEFECKEETPEEKLKREYENFLTDAGRIQYISQGPLAYDKKAVQQSRCRLAKQLNQTKYSARRSHKKVGKKEALRGGEFFDITVDPKPGHEYIFSSVEYYDDIVDFDLNKCPNDVAEIILEQEVLREYDMDCEQIVAWTSLEEAEVQPDG